MRIDSTFNGNNREANNHLKQIVYKTLHNKCDEVVKVFQTYGYPDIDDSDIEDFCNDLIGLFGNRWEQSTEIKYITGMIKAAGINKDILFLQGNEKRMLVNNLSQFYLHFITLFQKAQHIFDEQKEVKRWFEKYVFVNDDGEEFDNYNFVKSDDYILIQIADVVSGIFGQMFSYLNTVKNHQVLHDIKKMNDQQLQSAEILCRLYNKSAFRNAGFIFTIAP